MTLRNTKTSNYENINKTNHQNLTLELGSWVSVTFISEGSLSVPTPKAAEEAAEALIGYDFRGDESAGWSKWIWREKEDSCLRGLFKGLFWILLLNWRIGILKERVILLLGTKRWVFLFKLRSFVELTQNSIVAALRKLEAFGCWR